MADLWVRNAVVPCAFRRTEEILALAVQGPEPDPRVVLAMPAVLAWNGWSRPVLKAFARAAEPRARVLPRLAWLADVALAIDRRRGFPGGCRATQLADFLRGVPAPPRDAAWDDLGRPTSEDPGGPLWRRWRINFDADLDQFERRAVALAELSRRGPASDGSAFSEEPRASRRRP